MKIAFVFPGQGAQTVGMGKDIFESYPIVKDTYIKADEITGLDISKVSFEGDSDTLNTTKYTQLCTLVNSIAIANVLKEKGINASITAGLSLGEYSSLIYSGVLDYEEGLKLVKARGTYMQELLPKGDWKMAAVLGLDEIIVENICESVENGFVVVANYNTKGQIVISGDSTGIAEAEIKAKEAGAKKVMVLNTAGPFHTKKLIVASNALKEELQNYTFNEFNIPVVKNLDGKIYSDEDKQNIKEILASHIINPVRFTDTIIEMLNQGVDTFVEIGPGKTLSGFIKRIPTEKEIKILNINNVQSLEQVISILKEEI